MSISKTPAPARLGLASLRENAKVSIAVFVDTVGAGLTLPIVLIYFTLTTDIGLGTLGALYAAAAIIALPAGLIGGALTDRFGPKFSMVANNLLSGLGYLLYLFAHNSIAIFVALLLVAASERLYWTSWTAYVHNLSAGRPFEQWFSFLEAMKMAAMGLGAAAAVVLLSYDSAIGAHLLILANVATCILAAALFATQKVPASASVHVPESTIESVRGWVDVLKNRTFVAITIGQFFLGPIMVLPTVALSILFVTIWHMPVAVSPVLFAVSTGIIALLQTPITHAVRRWSRSTVIWIAATLVIACVIPLVVLPRLSGMSAWVFVIAVEVLLALASILYLPATNALMAEVPEAHIRGRAVAVFQTSAAVSMALFPTMIGLLESGTPWVLWIITAAAIAVGAAAYARAVRGLPSQFHSATPPS